MSRIVLITLVLCLITGTALADRAMKIVYFDSYPPRSWKEDGKMHGILVDIITEALQNRLGIPLVHEGYPWARAQAMVQAGQADALITVPTQKRREYTEISQEPVIHFNLYIATYKGNPKIKELEKVTSIDGLIPYSMVDYYGNGFAEKRLKEHHVQWLPQVGSVYPFLAARKADVLLVSDRGIYDLERLGYQDQIVVLPQPVYSLAFNLCIGKDSPFVKRLPEIDQVLKQMREEGISQQINHKYYTD